MERRARTVRKLQYLVLINKDAGSDWGTLVPDLPGCVATAKTIDAASAGRGPVASSRSSRRRASSTSSPATDRRSAAHLPAGEFLRDGRSRRLSPSAARSAPEEQPGVSVKTTKRRPSRKSQYNAGDLSPEYRFDYSKSKPNRVARLLPRDAAVVVLDPDVATYFRDSRRLNSFLRAAITALKGRRARRSG
jgi:hypothetical protein